MLRYMLLLFAPLLRVKAGCNPFPYAGYIEPAYFNFYQDLLGDDKFKRCGCRPNPPVDGEGCRRLPKTCFWGEQMCPPGTPGGTTQPMVQCVCQNEQWTCDRNLKCPSGSDAPSSHPSVAAIAPSQSPSASPSTPPSNLDSCPRPYTFPLVSPNCNVDLDCEYDVELSVCGTVVRTRRCTCTAGNPFTCTPSTLACDPSASCCQCVCGTVTEDPAIPIPGASIALVGADGSPISVPSVTDANGQYLFMGLCPGEYRVIQEQNPGGYPNDVADFDADPDGDFFDTDATVDSTIGVILLPGEVCDSGNNFVEAP